MKCDIKIMAAPKRYANVLNTCNVLGLDIEKDAFFDDREGGGVPYYTARKTLELPYADDSVTHRCILQDDIIVSHGFPKIIDQIVSEFPNAIITLFCSRSILKEMMDKNPSSRYVKIGKCGVYGQGVIFPRWMIPEMFAWAEREANGREILHDDVLYGFYALANGVEVYTTLPNIIQHNCPTSSLLGYNNKNKTSKVFDMNADQLDWSKAGKILSVSIPNSTNFYKED